MKQKNAPSDFSDQPVDDLVLSTWRMCVEVEGRSGERVRAAIFPVAVEDNFAVGAVEWDCAELWSSIVHVDFETPPEAPHLLLLWSALGDDAVHVVPCLGATRWRRVKLSLPPDWGISARRVSVEIDANTWWATLSFTDDAATWTAEVPSSFRETSVGNVLAEMCACFWLRNRSGHVNTSQASATARE
ncbi:MAG: hypothetical protein EON54_21730 [Alcaligenaceae bacterium]|nr:MAG: hypothetical protein EON54_21730 [Alcaligenaceae bacterium]